MENASVAISSKRIIASYPVSLNCQKYLKVCCDLKITYPLYIDILSDLVGYHTLVDLDFSSFISIKHFHFFRRGDSLISKTVRTKCYFSPLNMTQHYNQFSSGEFLALSSQMIRQDKTVVRARTSCHSRLTLPTNRGTVQMNIEITEYLKTLINFVGSWTSPLFHLVIELSAMPDVPETILSKAKEIEETTRQILDDLRWIFTKVFPTEEMKEEFPHWEHLSFLKSSSKNDKFLAMFNLSYCIDHDTKYILVKLRLLKCLITGKDC
ncbi:prolactin-8A6-like [Mastomys coucha]|uniref:prolactin-8A6-like n=1 Tax=Mastomys coucha TaxID=35658 RepID=UPI00126218DC|nr:prolactin-8A6-like [Mastomys coucha]